MIKKSMIEEIIGQYSVFHKFEIEQILFEADYPVLFSGIVQDKVYLFVCPLVNQKEILWIATETKYTHLINLLENKITIREAFLSEGAKKYIIRYDGHVVSGQEVSACEIPENLLPTAGEFMDAVEGEYKEEIAYYRSRDNAEKRFALPEPENWIIYPLKRQSMWAMETVIIEIERDMDMYTGKYWTYELPSEQLRMSVEA